MKANDKIRKLLLVISFAPFAFFVCSFFGYEIYSYNSSVAYNQLNLASSASGTGFYTGPYCQPNYFPLFLFFLILFSGFIFFAVKRAKLLNVAFFLITTSFFFLFYSFFIGLAKAIIENTEVFGVKSYEILFATEIRVELIIFICVSILFFWQIVYLLRMLIKTLQRKNKLP
jgi:hypothetical protein